MSRWEGKTLINIARFAGLFANEYNEQMLVLWGASLSMGFAYDDKNLPPGIVSRFVDRRRGRAFRVSFFLFLLKVRVRTERAK